LGKEKFMNVNWKNRIPPAVLAGLAAVALMVADRLGPALAQRDAPASAGVHVSFLEDPKADEPKEKEKDRQVVTSKATKREPARTINFKKTYGLPFDSLATLGSRIDAARRKLDPVALAHAARELNVAEKVSGTTASLTSKAMLAEAKELAALRRQVAELKAVFAVHQQIASEETKEEAQVNYWKTKIELAEKTAREERDALSAKKAPVVVPPMVLVNNYSSETVQVAINGNFGAEIPAGTSKWCPVQHNWQPITMTAYGDTDGRYWNRPAIWGTFKTYTWNLE
jgi:hypothetical protein